MTGTILYETAKAIAQAKSCNKVNPMTVRCPRYSKEEFAQRGDKIYESQVRSQVKEGNHGKIVAIDIDVY